MYSCLCVFIYGSRCYGYSKEKVAEGPSCSEMMSPLSQRSVGVMVGKINHKKIMILTFSLLKF